MLFGVVQPPDDAQSLQALHRICFGQRSNKLCPCLLHGYSLAIVLYDFIYEKDS
ncbi:MAG: hypothetical protein ACYC00_18730 [Eubacteriales bacterium]